MVKVAGFDMAGKSGSSTFDENARLRFGIDIVTLLKIVGWLVTQPNIQFLFGKEQMY